MFIDNINNQNFNTKINVLDNNAKKQNYIEPKSFVDHIKTALGEISSIQNNAKIDAEKFMLNKSEIPLNDIMINIQKSAISMQMAIQVRNKLVSSYQEIMNQQI
ncbi:flagellar hook-basal body complex protein FliE [Buchnera aphidicola (Hyadaphis tataricae)]|uniref:Flagellar hook-basal body complex protein FliE n=1 Tax=Buchnera aphidicola (Hyadaphis tataricae) TaxID=1241859 RepID=A0A4D6Y4Q4_9GAMM|nr:flagellar hook-basal body complex protein FliE [Buchnera aphidicola]QCI21394.1 flagellar hook-basal body complex protein FliE [Buchnera aphidicola (Hyadaphis tataricae)]